MCSEIFTARSSASMQSYDARPNFKEFFQNLFCHTFYYFCLFWFWIILFAHFSHTQKQQKKI